MPLTYVLSAVADGSILVEQVFEQFKGAGRQEFLLEKLPFLLEFYRSTNENVRRSCFILSIEVMQHRSSQENIASCGGCEGYLKHLIGALTCGAIPLAQVFLIFKMAGEIPDDLLRQSFAYLKNVFLQSYIDEDCFMKDAKGMVLLLMSSLSLKVMEKLSGAEIKREEEYFLILQDFGASGKRLKKIAQRLSEIK